MIEIKENKDLFCTLLRMTKREGTESVIKNLDKMGFFEAPASAGHHLNEVGGLVQHSLNVANMATQIAADLIKITPELKERLKDNSLFIAALLHDVCKTGIYKPAIKKRKTPMGYWQEYQGYDIDYSRFPIGHGEKSVIMLLQWGLKMSEEEMLAIRWHMAAWDLALQSYEAKECLNAASEKCPLLKIIQAADELASGVLEV